ncbi:hypothetical protein SD77_1543 [Bacillus badius]|uniref:Uncharacterized protein n=1 Tax=Bacillus badius TaxID=1455 RepID=A0ABR5ARC0_BACBA|nr:hypothetical protein SD78_4302 [Bacillus badius]KIL77300.1 hypothetical protein SD77_1543 [Bacillus badius]
MELKLSLSYLDQKIIYFSLLHKDPLALALERDSNEGDSFLMRDFKIIKAGSSYGK